MAKLSDVTNEESTKRYRCQLHEPQSEPGDYQLPRSDAPIDVEGSLRQVGALRKGETISEEQLRREVIKMATKSDPFAGCEVMEADFAEPDPEGVQKSFKKFQEETKDIDHI